MRNDQRDDTDDSQALTGGDIAKYRALVARISLATCHQIDQKCAVLRQNTSASDMESVDGKPRAECLFHWQQRGELEAYSDAG